MKSEIFPLGSVIKGREALAVIIGYVVRERAEIPFPQYVVAPWPAGVSNNESFRAVDMQEAELIHMGYLCPEIKEVMHFYHQLGECAGILQTANETEKKEPPSLSEEGQVSSEDTFSKSEEEHLLPLGSVVLLENDSLAMIIGYYPFDRKANEIDTYLVGMYPLGVTGDYSIANIRKAAIQQIIYIGYATEESREFLNSYRDIAEPIQSRLSERRERVL